MRCEEIKGKVDAYLEKELREDESIEFDDHLRACRNDTVSKSKTSLIT